MNILILSGGTQGLAIARDVNLAKHRVILLGDKGNYASVSKYVDAWIPCLFQYSSKEFFQLVLKVIADEEIDILIPMGDAAAEFMSKNKEILQKKVQYDMPDLEAFIRATDKNQLMMLCKEKGYPHPYTINSVGNDISKIKKTLLKFPLLIKPNITCGARGMTLVYTYEELLEKYPAIFSEYGNCHLQQYVKQGGAQVEVQLYISPEHELINSSVIYKYRWYPEKGGSSCCAVSVKNDKIVNILYRLLLDLNWVGFADFDTIENPDTGELLIMELNPRVPACVKCAIEAGVHWGEIIANAYARKPQRKYEYKEGEFLRHLGFEILWFLKSSNRFKTYPSWFYFIGKHIHYQDMSTWTDPLPFIFGSWRNLIKFLTHSEKKAIQR